MTAASTTVKDLAPKDGRLPAALIAIFAVRDEAFAVCEMIRDGSGQPVDYRFLQTSDNYEDVIGMSGIAGRTAREIAPDVTPRWIEACARVAFDGEPLTEILEVKASDRWLELTCAPMDPPGCFGVMVRNVTAAKRDATALSAALERSNKLLVELNHRVMNSLSMIASIISLEARGRQPGQGLKALRRIGDRVQAVAALYRTLSAGDSVDTVDAGAYLRKLVTDLVGAIGRETVAVDVQADGIRLSTRMAAPLGLIVNELVTNSLKYAFGPEGGRIEVVLEREGDACRLSVADDGRGLDADGKDGGGIGRSLVGAFALQLDGRVETATGPAGTRVEVRFPAA